MKEKQLVTSVSLPEAEAGLWRANRAEIMQFSERYLRIKMRNQIRRAVTRKYNRVDGEFAIVTTRFAPTEYDTLHFVAAALRVSVSLLIYGLILLWQKPSRRAIRRFFSINYSADSEGWDTSAGFLEESITFWAVENPGDPPPVLAG